MEHPEHHSHRLLLIGLGSIVLLIAAIALIAVLLFGVTKQQTVSVSPSPAPVVATSEEVSRSIADLNASMKQAAADQTAAKAAIKDSNYPKVSN